MQRKPIILIMTSRDEPDGLSAKLASAISAIGTHNAVVMSDDKYGSATKLSALDRLMDSGAEYQYLLERKNKEPREKVKGGQFSRRVRRIKNMLRRFRPEFILCVTPYAHHCAVDAKRKLKLSIGIIYMINSFAIAKQNVDDETNVYIVENPDAKASLVKMGVRSKNVMTMGLPFEIKALSPEEKEEVKQDMGLPRTGCVFVNLTDKKALEAVFPLLLDQGDVANLIAYCENAKLTQGLAMLAANIPGISVTFVKTKEKIDEYLPVCDLAITGYDISLIYKCLRLGIPPIIFEKDDHTSLDVNYLVNHGLCLKAKEDIDVVGLEYKLLQTDLANEIGKNGIEWTEMNSLENIANFLVSYIAV